MVFLHAAIFTNSYQCRSGISVEVWTPSTATVKPQTSQQVAVGAAKTSGDIEISVEGFYKKLNNLVEYKEGTSYLDNDKPWYDKVTQGRGKAYGLELFVQKKVGRITGFAGYTLSWNKRQFDDLNRGQWYYARYDHRHDFKATVNYRFNKHFDASASFLFATGSAVTAPVGRFASGFPGNGPVVINEYESRGNYRMQSYHRLDLSVNYIVTHRPIRTSGFCWSVQCIRQAEPILYPVRPELLSLRVRKFIPDHACRQLFNKILTE
ncbi:MAG: TonB-dependent receptor [Bacteroidota bacterium]